LISQGAVGGSKGGGKQQTNDNMPVYNKSRGEIKRGRVIHEEGGKKRKDILFILNRSSIYRIINYLISKGAALQEYNNSAATKGEIKF
jgi:hypothetical protein